MNLDAADRLASATARPGEASERARARGTPSPFTNFTSGPPLVHPLSWLRFSLTFNVGLNPYHLFCGPFNS
jgi:hypothetical protein